MGTGETKSKEKTQASKEEQMPEKEKMPEEKKTPEEKKIEKETSTSEPPVSNKDSEKFTKGDFPVVGIGASAGGLAAFEAFFTSMPDSPGPGMAFVLVQHLDPKHKSILTTLIGRYTNMSVYEVEDGMDVRPNCVYVIPPNRDMVYRESELHLLEPVEPHGHRTPIDFFFRSLAEEKKEQAIGIVLSGTGSDGTLGARAIKAEAGMVMAQAPESSEYDSMPRSVIDPSLADYILPPEEMPAQLIAYVTQAFGKITQPVSRAEDAMKKIFNMVFTHTGHDFSHYKKGTVVRRIERRMAVHNIKNINEYVSYLEQKPSEVESLFRDFLISVTSFFRNPRAFEVFREKIVPSLFVGKYAGESIRAWVPGCSTGEEAYSIGILLQEHMEELKQTFNIQIFATDIDSQAIEQARIGSYPPSISVDVSEERLERFFIQGPDGNYRIRKIIRDMVIFSEHDLVKDPPFSKLDLLSCRNLLIYMDGELQKRLIPLFYYALNPGKFLFLGSSETVNGFTNLFDILDRKSKLYLSKQNVGSEQLHSIVTLIPPRLGPRMTQRTFEEVPFGGKLNLRELTEKILLQHYAPVGVLVNEKGDILYIHGRTGMYLEPAQGEAGMNILKMAREGLANRLATALHRATIDKRSLFYSGQRVKTNGDFTTVNLALLPVVTGPDSERPDLFLITFEEPPKAEQRIIGKAVSEDLMKGIPESKGEVDERVSALMKELQTKEEDLKAANEELETSNEELKSSNEEMQSVNEELQSANEELESSKEELQSVNEELATVNAELQNRVADLSQANNDMNNLLAGTDIGTIFVDYHVRIMRFTPAVTRVIKLIPTDVGRPVGDIVSNMLGYDRLTEDVDEVLEKLTPREIEVQTRDGTWYLMRIRPYRTLENVIKGAVITFIEITELKQTRELLKESKAAIHRLSAVVVHDSNDAITLQDLEGHIMAWNPKAEEMYGWSEAEALTMNISSLIPQKQKGEELDSLKKLSRDEVLEPYRTQRLSKDGRVVDIWLTASPLVNETGEVYAISTTERKIKSGSRQQEDNK
ncbi:Chemotaxis protein methyltransferase CheR [Methanosarcina siciliae HI350]|uniref:protein-glutamate O-methyltransferase n=1 Tax=Methanosarcina siciliae HI350 TaxID=1434119 RepID=A0A0E3LA76_9EURY|nr:chemotaxis protein CheB [Methanosarcina siciliae]AKB31536.1 Chemotaxis protein methyltransferase CheR [Methanosarcina siciliae HI350]